MLSCCNPITLLMNIRTRLGPANTGRFPPIPIIPDLPKRRNRCSLMPLTAFIIFTICILAQGASAAVSIVCSSGDQFYVDAADNLMARYVSYQITNTGPTDYYDVWVEIGGFTGGVVSLATNETSLCHFDSLPVGTTETAFFYLQASGASSVPQSHTISVYAGEPPSGTLISSMSFTFESIGSSVSAASSKVTTIVSGPTPPSLGGILTIEVDGECGIIGRDGVMIFSPAGFPDWLADAYELVQTEITLSGGINANLTNQLYYSGTSRKSISYHAVYTFRVAGVASGPTVASPVATVSSGARMKHDKTDSYYEIDPILPAVNLLTIQKNILPPNICGGDTATYTITIVNSGALTAQIDSVIDILPSSPATPVYLDGTSQFNTVPCADPEILGPQMKWTGPFPVDPGGTATLAFGMIFPAVEGAYTNFAFAAVGNIIVDTTLDLSDYAPASVTIIVGMPDIMILKSTQVISDPVNGNNNPKAIPGATLLYTVTVTNGGIGMADDHSVLINDMIGSNASLFVGDISGGGPVVFEDGMPPSGMSYNYEGLNSLTDDLAFSSDSGASYTYTPVPDSTGFDPAVTNISVNPTGAFEGAAGSSYPNFTIKFMVRLH